MVIAMVISTITSYVKVVNNNKMFLRNHKINIKKANIGWHNKQTRPTLGQTLTPWKNIDCIMWFCSDKY